MNCKDAKEKIPTQQNKTKQNKKIMKKQFTRPFSDVSESEIIEA